MERRAQQQHEEWTQQLASERAKTAAAEEARLALTAENASLKQTIEELQSLQATVEEMEQKLKDLQSKLRGEEVAKQDASDRLVQVSTRGEGEVTAETTGHRRPATGMILLPLPSFSSSPTLLVTPDS